MLPSKRRTYPEAQARAGDLRKNENFIKKVFWEQGKLNNYRRTSQICTQKQE